jgi:hypothetical protein
MYIVTCVFDIAILQTKNMILNKITENISFGLNHTCAMHGCLGKKKKKEKEKEKEKKSIIKMMSSCSMNIQTSYRVNEAAFISGKNVVFTKERSNIYGAHVPMCSTYMC